MNEELEKILLIELYKCHYSAKETSDLTDLDYQKIASIFRGYRYAGIKKYNRFELSDTLNGQDAFEIYNNQQAIQ